jgi:hypothetical protein
MNPFEPYLTPDRVMPDWKNQNTLQRLAQSAKFMLLWDFITPAEYNRVLQRIESWYKQSPPAGQPLELEI